MVYHGQLSMTMINQTRPWSTMTDHDQICFDHGLKMTISTDHCQSMFNHGQSHLTMVNEYETMVHLKWPWLDHGKWYSLWNDHGWTMVNDIHFELTMVKPWFHHGHHYNWLHLMVNRIKHGQPSITIFDHGQSDWPWSNFGHVTKSCDQVMWHKMVISKWLLF